MMFNNFREQRYIRRTVYRPVGDIIAQIESFRKISNNIAVCPQTTAGSWQGVKTATLGLFPENTLILPQYYSRTVYTQKELKTIAYSLASCKFNNIVFSGFPTYFEDLIKYIKSYQGDTQIALIYHGSLASNAEDRETIPMLTDLLNLCGEGYIQKLGFVKKGMKETFQVLRKMNTYHLLLKTDIAPLIPAKIDHSTINIGVFSHDQYRKNIHNQVAAALMIKNSKAYVRENYGFEFLGNISRIEELGFNNSYSDFLSKAISMDINFYVSFSECWGQVITESLAHGVPCLAADNSGLFDYDDELHKILVVKEFDDSNAIFKQAKIALKNTDLIKVKGREYVKQLNQRAEEKFEKFLND